MEDSEAKAKSKFPLILIALLVLVVVAGAAYYAGSSGMLGGNTMEESGEMAGKEPPPTQDAMAMTASETPAITDKQTAQLAEGTKTDTTEKTFDLTGGNYYFVPNKITVNQGDKVTFILTNAGGTHDLLIDELGVKTPIIKTGESATVTFTADKKGTFEYYCSLPGHREKGMVGTLTVE